LQAVGECRFRNAAFRYDALRFDNTFDHTATGLVLAS
jgi:hypothetical protein